MKYCKLIALISFSIIFISCSSLLSKMYGIKQLDGFNKERYNDFISKLKATDKFYSLVSDTNQYNRVINLGRTAKAKNDLGQPIQILYFENNEVKSFHANCYVTGGLTNLNWNTEDRFSSFLPKSAVNLDSLTITLDDYIKIYPNILNHKNKKYTVLVFWTLMLEKISNSAIETVFANTKKFGKENETSIILINSDEYFSNIE